MQPGRGPKLQRRSPWLLRRLSATPRYFSFAILQQKTAETWQHMALGLLVSVMMMMIHPWSFRRPSQPMALRI